MRLPRRRDDDVGAGRYLGRESTAGGAGVTNVQRLEPISNVGVDASGQSLRTEGSGQQDPSGGRIHVRGRLRR